MLNIMDTVFNGMPASEFYRSHLFPELFPHQKQMLIENWSIEDLELYVGGEYTPGYFNRRVL